MARSRCEFSCQSGGYTPSGHVVGMLDRDQRTAKIPTYPTKKCRCSVNAVKDQKVQEQPFFDKVHARFATRGWRSRVRETAQRLKQVLVVGTYLLSIVSVPSSLSAPAGPMSSSDRRTSHPKWINPCGIKRDEMLQDAYTEIPQVSASELLSQIISQAKIALSHANKFKEDYAEKVHNMDSVSLNDLWKHLHYDWLPSAEEIPKRLGETMSEDSEHLASLRIDDTLIELYHQLQKIAVGLEAVAWDQEDEKGQFYQNFTETENYLRSLLCEIQMAIIERGLTQKPDITRELMGEDMRQLPDNSSRDVRDWLIYRDYINALEYTVQAFQYLRRTLPN